MKHHMLRSIACLSLVGLLALPGSIQAGPKGDTIVDVAIAANSSGPFQGQFDTLIAALQAADPSVLSTLAGNGQFTVFAPTDDAFAALGLDENNVGGAFDVQVLTEILLYHVTRGRRSSADVTSSTRIRTLQRGFLSVSGTQLGDNVGGTANIIVTDVLAANGIIHAIDAVVLPFAP